MQSLRWNSSPKVNKLWTPGENDLTGTPYSHGEMLLFTTTLYVPNAKFKMEL